jgi:hypothetical protein
VHGQIVSKCADFVGYEIHSEVAASHRGAVRAVLRDKLLDVSLQKHVEFLVIRYEKYSNGGQEALVFLLLGNERRKRLSIPSDEPKLRVASHLCVLKAFLANL